MKIANGSRRWIVFTFGVLFVASSCNLFSNIVDPVDDVVAEIEEVAEQVDVENLEDLQKEIQTMVPEIPTDLEGLQATAESIQEDFNLGEMPPDIPVVAGETENLFSSEAFVSYTTPMNFDDVLAFYQEEMPKNGWEADEDGTFTLEGTALLSYSKDGQIVIVTISTEAAEGSTTVLITIQPE